MKLLILSAVVAFVLADEFATKPSTRTLQADVLRDFPDLCFASTGCTFHKIGEEWDLKPFCGKAKCQKGPDGKLLELVSDCGPPPVSNPKCKISAKTNVNATYPACCPVFDCEPGVRLTFQAPKP